MSRPPHDKNLPSGTRAGGLEGPGKPADPWIGFEPYAQLCRALLPRTQSVSIFDARGALRWSTDHAAAAELTRAVAGALATAHSVLGSAGDIHVLPASVPAYVCWIRDDSAHLLASAVIAWN